MMYEGLSDLLNEAFFSLINEAEEWGYDKQNEFYSFTQGASAMANRIIEILNNRPEAGPYVETE